LVRNRFANIDIFRSLQTFWRQLEGPRDHEGNGKTNHNQHYHQPDCPVWNLKERENLRRYLHQQPCDDCVGDRDLINIAPLQLSKEVLWVHSELLRTTRDDFFRECFETRITAQRIEERVNSNIPY